MERSGRKKIFGPSEKNIDSLRLSLFRGVGFEGKKLVEPELLKSRKYAKIGLHMNSNSVRPRSE